MARAVQQFFNFFDVGGDVNAYGVVHRFDYVHVKTVFQPAKLFELFDAFEFAGGERGKFEQRFSAIAVEADMFPVFSSYAVAGIADPGDGGAGKIESVGRRNPGPL